MKLLARWHNWEFWVKILKKYQFELTLKTSNHFFLSQYPSYHARCIFWNYLPSWNLKIVTCSFIIQICMNNGIHHSITPTIFSSHNMPVNTSSTGATYGKSSDPLCPLGFHPQVRWPTRCKRCFRNTIPPVTKTVSLLCCFLNSLQQLQRYDIISRRLSNLYWLKGQTDKKKSFWWMYIYLSGILAMSLRIS